MDNINLNRENGQKLWAADWNKLISTINLIIDAVNNQSNLPGITKLSQLINDSGFITQEDVKGKVNKGELAEVATSGSYNDLKDKPSQMTGPQGPEGKSAYQVAVLNGFIGTPQLWLNSLKGEDGLPGLDGENGLDGQDGLDGSDGKSAYELAVEDGYEGTLELWLESLHGQDGQGADETLDANGHDYVEIEGVKWATKNVGALNIYDLGTAFDSDPEITDEALSWGGDWRSPTKEEFYSLMLLCRMVQATINNVEGVKFIYKKDPSITLFFPHIEECPYRTKTKESIEGWSTLWSDFLFEEKYVKTIECFGVATYGLSSRPTRVRPVLRKYDDRSKLLYRPTVMDRECAYDGDGGMSIYNDELAINWNGHKNSAYGIYKNKYDVSFFMSKTLSSKYYNSITGESSNDISNIITPYDFSNINQKFYDEFGGDWELPQEDDLLFLLLNNKITVNFDEEYFTVGNDTKRYFLDYKLYDCFSGEEDDNYYGFVGASCNLLIRIGSLKTISVLSSGYYIGKTIGIVHCSTPQTLILSDVSVSGDYNDLKNLPSIPDEQILSDWNQSNNTKKDYIKNKPYLSAVAITGSYNNLNDRPGIFDTNGHNYVEIGGIKWATMNVGASNVTDIGLYFLYGDTLGYTALQVGIDKTFDWDHYKYYSGTSPYHDILLTKYNLTDNKTVLDIEDDPVASNWGGKWRSPTDEELKILINSVNITWVSDYQNSGVSGAILTDKNDSSKILFFPSSGWCINNEISYSTKVGCLSGSAHNTFYHCDDYGCFIIEQLSDGLGTYVIRNEVRSFSKYIGLQVRGVLDLSNAFSTVAFTGDYNDLKNKPTIPSSSGTQIQVDWNQLDNSLVDYIKNKPAIPVAVSDLQNNLGFLAIANEHEYIEIGGLKWATMNVGANSVTDIGLYFQWGDTQGYTANQVGSGSGQKYFGWDDYKYTNDGGTTMSKYNSTDGKTVLEASDDAVTAAWGSQWRTPTYNEFLILSNATTITFTENYKGSGVAGMVCTDKTDNSKVLFFPLTGECSDGNINDNMSGCYWTGDFSKSDARCSNAIEFYKNAYDWGGPNWNIGVGRKVGYAIRGIMHPSIQKFAAKVAETGDYNDLTNKPAALILSDWSQFDNTAKDFIKNKPNISECLRVPLRDYVDLGLPSGTLWAKYNIGATSETEYGNYYQYGRGANTYQVTNSYSKYRGTENPLSASMDTATQEWGGDWHMPTQAQCQELLNNTVYAWVTDYKGSGVNGMTFAANEQTLFIPAAGYYNEHNKNSNTPYSVGEDFYIYSSTPFGPEGAYSLYSTRSNINLTNVFAGSNYSGYSIRGVLDGHLNYQYASKIALTGSYNDLTNKPTIPAALILADWNQTDNTQVDYIKNKPTITNGTNGKSAYLSYVDTTSDNPVLTEQQWIASLHGTNGTNGTNGTDGITPHIDLTTGNWFIGSTDTGVHALGPAGQGGSGSGVLSDWNETDNTSLAYIANKPTIPTVPSNETATSGGNTLSVVTTGDKYNWNNKANIWQGTQAQYDTLSPNYDSNTIYIITAAS